MVPAHHGEGIVSPPVCASPRLGSGASCLHDVTVLSAAASGPSLCRVHSRSSSFVTRQKWSIRHTGSSTSVLHLLLGLRPLAGGCARKTGRARPPTTAGWASCPCRSAAARAPRPPLPLPPLMPGRLSTAPHRADIKPGADGPRPKHCQVDMHLSLSQWREWCLCYHQDCCLVYGR